MTHDHRRANFPQHVNGYESLTNSAVSEAIAYPAEHGTTTVPAAAQMARHLPDVEHRFLGEHLALTAHELRNPLTAISLQAQLGLRHVQRDGYLDAADTERILRMIVQEAAQIAKLLDLLLVAQPEMIYVLPLDQHAGA